MAGLAAALPEYELLGELGRGAMGVVLLGRHRSLGRRVAIKELPPAFAAEESVRRRFLREARTVAGLSHPHVVAVYDFVDRDGHLALIMEELPGGTVWDRFTTSGVSAPTACALLLATASGLDDAHRHGVLHRDVKPENLMFTAEGALKVTDFGMAKVMGGEKTLATANGVVLGTPAYMAPEQAEGAPVGPAADVYACGTMLFELITGRLPFATAPTPMSMLVRRIAEEAPPILTIDPDTPPALAPVVDTALARAVDDRFAEVSEFAVALATAAAQTWGIGWLEATGVGVTGSDLIERAAKASSLSAPPSGRPQPRPRSRRLSDDRSQRAPDTVLDAPAGAPSGAARGSAVDLRAVSIAQLVDVSDIGSRRSATLPAVLSLVVAVGLLGLAMVGGERFSGPDPAPESALSSGLLVAGQSAAADVVDVDFSAPIVIEGLEGGRVRAEATLLGIPLGDAEAPIDRGRAELDPSYLRWTTPGRIDLDLIVDGDLGSKAMIEARATQPWLSTGPTIVAAMLGLFGLASVQSNARGLRSGRFRVGPLLGLAVGGGLVGVSVVALIAFLNDLVTTTTTMAIGAAVAAVAALLLGEAVRRRRRDPSMALVVG